jgi:hypothetical protein
LKGFDVQVDQAYLSIMTRDFAEGKEIKFRNSSQAMGKFHCTVRFQIIVRQFSHSVSTWLYLQRFRLWSAIRLKHIGLNGLQLCCVADLSHHSFIIDTLLELNLASNWIFEGTGSELNEPTENKRGRNP